MSGGPVLVAMSGGVDSSVAAALLAEQGYDVTGVTMKLWGGESDTGCCSVADVDDARRVCQQLGIDHHVFNFGDEFTTHVVDPYVADHQRGRTPNPCIECNRHLKFDRLLRRAGALGFDRVATGHHARLVTTAGGSVRLSRARDRAKDQSYVLYMLGQDVLRRIRLPVGDMTKDEVRAEAHRLGLRTAAKPDSQDVCFITSTGGRKVFLGQRIGLNPAEVVDSVGAVVGGVEAVELVTVGQRRGLGFRDAGEVRYVTNVDVGARRVSVGTAEDLLDDVVAVDSVVWADAPVTGAVAVQCSAHGQPRTATITAAGPSRLTVAWQEPQPRVAAGQSVVFYEGDEVVGGGIAT